MRSSVILAVLAGAIGIKAQCNDTFFPGSDTVIFTTPHNYSQVVALIGDFANLTWSGNPEGSVTLNGPDNTVGTSRSYDYDGTAVVETLTTYEKPADGPYVEIKALSLIQIASANLSLYADFDGISATETCDGFATTLNFTINFCANDVSTGTAIFHSGHETNEQNIMALLGGQNFTSCDALTGNGATGGTYEYVKW